MTRIQYLELKSELKKLGKIIKEEKAFNKECQKNRSFNGSDYFSIKRKQEEFRTKHIFMSLVRGHKRIEIENNFETKEVEKHIEESIQSLCLKYDFEIELNQKKQILKISPKDLQIENVA